ncbi:MAG TPA: hypothetical protein VF042_05585 [Gemmatimonadaceae bacterium]
MELNDTATQDSMSQSSSTIDQATGKARQAASDATRKVSEELRTRADTTKTRAADALGSVAQALTNSAQQLRSQGGDAPVDYVENFGNQIRRASDYLRTTDTDDIVRNAESFARRQPAVFLGGAFVLGFLASRLVKSSQGAGTSGGTIPHNRSLVPQGSTWTGDREASLSGFREPASAAGDDETNINYTRQFGRETL